jgi:hypothetical protein
VSWSPMVDRQPATDIAIASAAIIMRMNHANVLAQLTHDTIEIAAQICVPGSRQTPTSAACTADNIQNALTSKTTGGQANGSIAHSSSRF